MACACACEAGFRVRHHPFVLTGNVPEMTCECDLSARPRNPSAAAVPVTLAEVSVEHKDCVLPKRWWVSTANDNVKPFTPATQRHLSKMLGYADEAGLVRASGASFSCIDGRTPAGGSLESVRTEARALHSFGGDMGEFMLLLALLEKRAKGGRFYAENIEQIFRGWIDTPPSARNDGQHRPTFYFHSDDTTLARIAASLGYELAHRNASWRDPVPKGTPGYDPLVPHKQRGPALKAEEDQLPFLDFTAPPLHLQSLLLEELSKPENQGCAHVRLMMTYPDLYGVPLWVSQAAIRTYFKVLWNKDMLDGSREALPLYYKLKFVVSTGKHEERMWINLRTSRACDNVGVQAVWANRGTERAWSRRQAKAALVAQSTSGADDIDVQLDAEMERARAKAGAALADATQSPLSAHDSLEQAFVFHPQAVAHLRESMAEVAAGRNTDKSFGVLLGELNAIGDAAEQRTKKLLAKDLPEYNVRLI